MVEVAGGSREAWSGALAQAGAREVLPATTTDIGVTDRTRAQREQLVVGVDLTADRPGCEVQCSCFRCGGGPITCPL